MLLLANRIRLLFQPGNRGELEEVFLLFSAAGALAVLSHYNYLLFHCLVEIAIASVSFVAFAFAWNCRRFEHGYLLIVGLSGAFSGAFNILHALSFKGMNVFETNSPMDLSLHFWLASRVITVSTLLIGPYFLKHPLPFARTVLFLCVGSAGLFAAVVTHSFPSCITDEQNFTVFKEICEYTLTILLVAAAALIFWRRQLLSPYVRSYLGLYFAFSVSAELTISFFPHWWLEPIVLGHIFLLFAMYAFYKAIVETGIRRPFDLLFRELKDAIQARDEFLSIASHELKTPLTPLKMQLQSLRRMFRADRIALMTPALAEHNIEISLKQIDRLTYLIDNLLDVSRISAGKLALRRELTDVKSIYLEIVARHEGERRTAGVELTLDVPEVPLIVDVDLLRIDQVITNLFMNALKYAPGSKLNMGAKTEGNYALLWLEDNGPGIAKAAQARIFERFERAQPSDKVTGLGLGLFISRQIVEAHGGSLRLKSDPGYGSRFEMRLPLPETK